MNRMAATLGELENTHRKDMYIVIDTETLGYNYHVPEYNQKVFDLGYQIIDSKGKIYSRGSFLTQEFYRSIIEKHAFYQEKIEYYDRYVEIGYSKVMPYHEIIEHLEHECNVYDVDFLVAYNLGFDDRVLNKTNGYLYGSGTELVLSNLIKYDLYHVASQTILNTPRYKKWAMKNYNRHINLETFNIKTGAESCFSYLINEPDFIEEHTALSDVEIECAILVEILKTSKDYDYSINPQSWRLVNHSTEKNINLFCKMNPHKKEFVEKYRKKKKEKEDVKKAERLRKQREKEASSNAIK